MVSKKASRIPHNELESSKQGNIPDFPFGLPLTSQLRREARMLAQLENTEMNSGHTKAYVYRTLLALQSGTVQCQCTLFVVFAGGDEALRVLYDESERIKRTKESVALVYLSL